MPDASTEIVESKSESKPVKVKPGDKVRLVVARGEPVEATVTKVHKGNLLDLEAEFEGKPLVITESPHDPARKLSDSWS